MQFCETCYNRTSGEHFAAASANFSMGLVLPGILIVSDEIGGEESVCWESE